jgi:ABC-2 type transport system permease protein
MSVIALLNVSIHWSVFKALFFVVAIIGGVLVEAAIQLAFSCVILRSPAALSVGMWIEEIMSTFGNYPLSILPTLLRGVFTFVLPVAFIAYLPTLVLLGRTSTLGSLSWLAVWSPVIGLLLFLLAKRLWNWSLNHYVTVGG